MDRKTNMNIIFCKNQNKEFFNNKYYPLGTTALSIINYLSFSNINNNFVLESYKNVELLQQSYKILIKIAKNNHNYILKKESLNLYEEQLSSFIDILEIYNHIPIEIENIQLSEDDFIDLVKFMMYFDSYFKFGNQFFQIHYLKYYFSTIKDYKIPQYNVYNDIVIENNANFYDKIQEQKKCNFDEVLKNDKQILKELKKSKNFIYEYECNTFIDIVLAFLSYIIEQNLHLKKCRLCNRFFLASHGNAEYCNYIRPQYVDETLEQYKKKSESCSKYYKRVLTYKNLPPLTHAIRDVKARIKKRIKNGTDTEEYLEEWLQTIKEKKSLLSTEKLILWIKNDSDTHQKRRKKECQ